MVIMLNYLIHGIELLVGVAVFVAIPYLLLLCVLAALHGFEQLKTRRFFAVEYLFVVYMVSLAGILGFFGQGWSLGKDISYNLIPFALESPVLMILNCVAFIPLGVFFPLLFKRFRSFKWTALLGLALSFCVELVQMFLLGRLGDIDDVIFNTLGCCCGFGLYSLFLMLIKRYKKNQVGYGTAALFFAIFALIWGFSYKGIPVGYSLLLASNLKAWAFIPIKAVELVGMAFALVGLAVGIRHREDFLAKAGIVVAACAVVMSLFFFFTVLTEPLLYSASF